LNTSLLIIKPKLIYEIFILDKNSPWELIYTTKYENVND